MKGGLGKGQGMGGAGIEKPDMETLNSSETMAWTLGFVVGFAPLPHWEVGCG